LFVFGGVWQRYIACPMRRIAPRAVPCQTTRQNQTKWVILKEICFKQEFGQRSSARVHDGKTGVCTKKNGRAKKALPEV
tara:strand:- start:15386 stop:15622 length:237 start_codon:yes stop_codon:yes gene_type:complete